jgi:hypothetical protein
MYRPLILNDSWVNPASVIRKRRVTTGYYIPCAKLLSRSCSRVGMVVIFTGVFLRSPIRCIISRQGSQSVSQVGRQAGSRSVSNVASKFASWLSTGCSVPSGFIWPEFFNEHIFYIKNVPRKMPEILSVENVGHTSCLVKPSGDITSAID